MDDAELFDLLLRLPLAEREAAARQHCGDNEVRIRSVLDLVQFADSGERLATRTETDEQWSEPDRVREGERIGRYVVSRFLGQGAFGQVYEVYDLELRRHVALKLLHEDRGSELDLRRFRREAQSLAAIEHPNVVRVYDVGAHEGRRYLTMERIDGQSLRAWLEGPGRERGWRELLALLLPAARGLHAAHLVGIVHRDFKPENVMLDRTGRVVVTDFGIARAMPQDREPSLDLVDSTALARTGAGAPTTAGSIGTPRYMAPEQHHGRATPRSDEYAFCVVLLEALSPREAAIRVPRVETDAEATPPEPQRWSEVRGPRWLHAMLARGLSVDDEDRYPDVAALVGAIESRLRRPRQVLWSLVAVLVVASIAYAIWRRPSQTCAQWDASAVARGFEPTWAALDAVALDHPRAERAAAQVSAMRAAVTSTLPEWAMGRTAACEQHVNGMTEAATARARDDCFARWHDDLRRRLAWTLDHPAALVDADVVGELQESPARCGHVDAPTVEQPQLDPASAEAIDTLLREARDLRLQGDFDGSARAAEAARGIVDEVGHEGYRAEALHRLGVLAAREHDPERAVALLHEAARACERSGRDALAAEIDTDLAETIALAPWMPAAQAEAALALGRAKLVRTGGGDRELEAKQSVIDGHLARGAGRHADAEAAYRRAATQLDALGRSVAYVAASTQTNLARAIVAQRRYDEGIALAEDALVERRVVLGEHHPLLADDLYQLGLAYQLAGEAAPEARGREHFETARMRLRSALALAREGGERQAELAAAILVQLTAVRLQLGALDEIVAHDLAEIVEVFEAPRDRTMDARTRLDALRIVRNAHASLENWADARRLAARIVGIEEGDAAPIDPQRREDRLVLASYELYEGHAEQAVEQLRFLEATQPPRADGDSEYAATLRQLWTEVETLSRQPLEVPDARRPPREAR